jgi:peptidoglycan/LPS O-acetylase OafA/YrhL
METIATRSVIAYPMLQAEAAAVAAVWQLLDVRTGEGIVNYLPHTRGIIERYVPHVVPAMMAARQQQADISFTAINWIDYPAGLLAMALLPVLIFVARGERFRRTRELAAFMTIAILGNAVVCGVFSNPHDRYGARIVWLASLTVLIALVTALRQPEAGA